LRAIVVGNGTHTGFNGHLINDYDIVIRMGAYRLRDYEHIVGTKTDIASVARIENLDPIPPIVWAGNPFGFGAIPPEEVKRHYGRKLINNPKEAIDLAYAAVGEGTHPTLGLLTIFQAIVTGRHYFETPITITGFDFGRVGFPRYYWDQTPQYPVPCSIHRGAHERVAVKYLIGQGLVRLLNPRDIYLLEELPADYPATLQEKPIQSGRINHGLRVQEKRQ
jgi:hypothetical protein